MFSLIIMLIEARNCEILFPLFLQCMYALTESFSTLHMHCLLLILHFMLLAHSEILVLLDLYCMFLIPYGTTHLLFLPCMWLAPYRILFCCIPTFPKCKRLLLCRTFFLKASHYTSFAMCENLLTAIYSACGSQLAESCICCFILNLASTL